MSYLPGRVAIYTELSAQQYVNTFSYPFDVAVTEVGQLAVAEYGYHTVSRGVTIYGAGGAVAPPLFGGSKKVE